MGGEYKVQFVGLAYFLREGGGRHVLYPDGRSIQGVASHLATISLAVDELANEGSFTGWRDEDIMRTPVPAAVNGSDRDRELIQFVLSGDSIEIEGASRAVRDEPLIAGQHDGILQPLTEGVEGPRVRIVAREAKTVADMEIRRGTLQAFLYPGRDDDGNAAIISELRVPYDRETVTITVRPKGGVESGSLSESDVRTIVVRNGSEIVIVNASRPGGSPVEDETEHFNIYRQLSPALVLGTPRPTPIGVIQPSSSTHLLFLTPGAIGSSIKCSNTCC